VELSWPELTRPLNNGSDAEATEDGQVVRVGGSYILPVGALVKGKFKPLVTLDYERLDSDINLTIPNGYDTERDQNLFTLGVGYRLKLAEPDLSKALRAYLLVRGHLGWGSTETQLPPTEAGLRDLYFTEESLRGLGVEGGFAGRLHGWTLESFLGYDSMTRTIRAGFDGPLGQESDNDVTDLRWGAYLGHDFGVVHPLIGLSGRKLQQSTYEVDGRGFEETVVDSLLLQGGFRLDGKGADNLTLVGYDVRSGRFVLYEQLDHGSGIGVYGQLSVPVKDDNGAGLETGLTGTVGLKVTK
jgi:hypothetical protein